MIKPDDFNVVLYEHGETYVRVSEIQKLEQYGAISINEDKMNEYKKETRMITNTSMLDVLKNKYGITNEFKFQTTSGIVVFDPVYYAQLNEGLNNFYIYNADKELITVFSPKDVLDSLTSARIVIIK